MNDGSSPPMFSDAHLSAGCVRRAVGNCESHNIIETAAQCAAAAVELGLDDTTPTSNGLPSLPHGCYFSRGTHSTSTRAATTTTTTRTASPSVGLATPITRAPWHVLCAGTSTSLKFVERLAIGLLASEIGLQERNSRTLLRKLSFRSFRLESRPSARLLFCSTAHALPAVV